MPVRDILNIRRFFPSSEEMSDPLIVDVLSKEGKMFIRLQNREPYPLKEISIRFSQPLPGPDGRVLNDLNIFKRLQYLAPGRTIDIFAGQDNQFLNSLRDPVLKISIRLQVQEQKRYRFVIKHDLSIYQDLPQIQTRSTI